MVMLLQEPLRPVRKAARPLPIRLVGNDGLGGQEQTSDGGGVLQSGAGHLDRVGHTGGQQVFVGVGGGVEAFAIRQGADGVDDHVTGHAGVLGDLLDRGLDGAEHDGGTGSLFAGQGGDGLGLLGLGSSLNEGHATARQQAFLDGGLGVT